MTAANKAKQSAGHRQRLRERLLADDNAARSEAALLELLLTYAIPRKDVQPIARELLTLFGGLPQVLAGSPAELAKVSGIGEAAIALLKAVYYIKTTPAAPVEPRSTMETGADTKTIPHPIEPQNIQPITTDQLLPTATRPESPTTPTRSKSRRKFQVSNGYLLRFDQLARVLHFLLENRAAKRIAGKVLEENTGLTGRQLASLVSMGAAMGLIRPGTQILTPTGWLIAEHDIFLEKKASLEWCHYVGAGTVHNLIWFEIFNGLLPDKNAMTQAEWSQRLRHDLAGQYSERTVKKSLREEVHFVVDAYRVQNFRKLELLQQAPDGRLYLRRYPDVAPLVFCAMLYDFAAAGGTQLLQVSDLITTPGSPGLLFGLDAITLREKIEALHERGWLRYETTHNLDQIRLKSAFPALEWLTAHFQAREPREHIPGATGGLFP